MARIDLHSHSSCSDGSFSPQELVQRAAERGVEQLALTDHDTVSGVQEAIIAASTCNIRLIPGIELSTMWDVHTIHVLGLNLHMEHTQLHALVQQQESSRRSRGEQIAERLVKLGYSGIYEDAIRLADVPEHVSRVHFAQVLVQRGVTATVQQAFDRYLKDGKKAAVPAHWINMVDGIDLLKKTGAQVILAHPLRYDLGSTKLRTLLEVFADAGGAGVELATAHDDSHKEPWLSAQAKRLKLCGSQGSDFHGAAMPWVDIGRCFELPSDVEPVWNRWSAEL